MRDWIGNVLKTLIIFYFESDKESFNFSSMLIILLLNWGVTLLITMIKVM